VPRPRQLALAWDQLPLLEERLHFQTFHVGLTSQRQSLEWSLILTDDYGALEPAISGKIMELHHDKHHATYVNSFNTFSEQLQKAQADGDIAAQIALKPMINFHGGGHLNHSLFWENLAPKSQGGGDPPSGALSKAIDETYGSLDALKSKFNAALAGIQGSGWAWLVKDSQTGDISIQTYAVSYHWFDLD
jgi:Fe-Mn family superoxide dismutase